MRASDEAINALCESLAAEIGACVEFELDLGELIGRYRRKHDRAMRDAEAARLLPLGAETAADRLGVCRATVYNMTHRFRESKRTATA